MYRLTLFLLLLLANITASFSSMRAPISDLDVTEHDRWSVSLVRSDIIRNAVIFEGKESRYPLPYGWTPTWAWGVSLGCAQDNEYANIHYWTGVQECRDKMSTQQYSIIQSWVIPSEQVRPAHRMINNDKEERRIKHYIEVGNMSEFLPGIEENCYIHNSPSYAARILFKCGIVFNIPELFPIMTCHTALTERREKLKQKLHNTCQWVSAIEMEMGYYSPSSYDMETLRFLDLSQLEEIARCQEVRSGIINTIMETRHKELDLKDREDQLRFQREQNQLLLIAQRNHARQEERRLKQERKINLYRAQIQIDHQLEMQALARRKAIIDNEIRRIELQCHC